MGAKDWLFLVVVLILISGCSVDKTIPVITDVTGSVVQGGGQVNLGKEVIEEDIVSEEEIVSENEITGDIETEEIGTEDNEEDAEETIVEELPPGAHIITIKELKLEPQKLTINHRDTVVWKHEDTWEEDEDTRHYLAAHSNEFRSPIFYYGETFEHTFENIGTFTYIDVLYKDRETLRGEIVVE